MAVTLQGVPVRTREWANILFQPVRKYISCVCESSSLISHSLLQQNKTICVVAGFNIDRESEGVQLQQKMQSRIYFYVRGRLIMRADLLDELSLARKSSEYSQGLTLLVLDTEGMLQPKHDKEVHSFVRIMFRVPP
jgi:hypothetical protein